MTKGQRTYRIAMAALALLGALAALAIMRSPDSTPGVVSDVSTAIAAVPLWLGLRSGAKAVAGAVAHTKGGNKDDSPE